MSKKFLTLLFIFILNACGSETELAPLTSKLLGSPVVVSNIVSFNGIRQNYTITKTDTAVTIKDNVGDDGIKTISSATSLKFLDVNINLTISDLSKQISAKDLNSLIELYIAFFNRVPDADGLAYWIGQILSGQNFNDIAETFYRAGINYSSLTGYSAGMSNTDFINVIYRNVLGRPYGADTEGLTYWTNQLVSGVESRGTLVSSIITAAHGLKNDPTYFWVASLLENKISIAKAFAVEQGLNYNSPTESIKQGMAIIAGVTSTETSKAAAIFSSLSIQGLPIVYSGCATAKVNGQPGSGSDFAKIIGDFTVSTNTWGKGFSTGWTDCLTSSSLTSTGVKAQFDWDWPYDPIGPNPVRSYSQIVYTPDQGTGIWKGVSCNPSPQYDCKNIPGQQGFNPLPITQVGSMTVTHDIEITTTGYNQTFYSFFLDPKNTQFIESSPALVEMCICLHPQARGPHDVVGTITVSGNIFWVEYWKDIVDGHNYVGIAFESQKEIFKTSIPLKPFFDYIIQNNLLPSNYYIHSIQLGTEAINGKGTFKVNEFHISKNDL